MKKNLEKFEKNPVYRLFVVGVNLIKIGGIIGGIIGMFSIFFYEQAPNYIIGVLAVIFIGGLVSFAKKKKEEKKKKERQECFSKTHHLQKTYLSQEYADEFRKKWKDFYIFNEDVPSNKILEKWIIFLRKKKDSSYSHFLEQELLYIYTITQFFFTQDEIIEGSKKHFQDSKTWSKFLKPNIKVNKKNHIMNANHWISENLKDINLEKINFIDFGSGLLSSLLYIASNNNGFKQIKYLGIDINSNFVDISNSILNKKFKKDKKHLLLEMRPDLDKKSNIESLNNIFFNNLNDFNNIRHKINPLLDDFYVIEENLNNLNLHKKLLQYENKINLITANYCLHHIPNPILIENNILNKNCFYLFGDNADNWPAKVIKAMESLLFKHKKIESFIKELNHYNEGLINETKMAEVISEYIENDKLIIYQLVSKLLTINGKFFLSDPNGYSDWNASEIFKDDWSHAIAHFGNIKSDLELIEKNIPSLKFSEAYVQVKGDRQEIVSIPLSRDEIVNCGFLSKIKKYKDWNLGYIIGFVKINTTQQNV